MKTIKIAGIEYKILFKNLEEMQGSIGLANFNTQEIWIGNSFTKQTQHIAEIHEVLHILSDTYNLALSEVQVKFLAHAIIALVYDNPNLDIFNKDLTLDK